MAGREKGVANRLVSIRKKKPTRQALSIPQASTHLNEEQLYETNITLTKYFETTFTEKTLFSIEKDTVSEAPEDQCTWINIAGPISTEMIDSLGKYLDIHPLVLEDIRTEQRPKVENYGEYVYIVLRALNYNSENNHVENEQVSLIIKQNLIISFQEKERHLSLNIRERLRSKLSNTYKHRTGYILYTIIDVIVDHYFHILEKLGERLEELEDKLLTVEPSKQELERIHNLRKEMIVMRKSTWPLREVISRLLRGEYDLVTTNVAIYLRDVYDHIIQAIDTVDTFRDLVTNVLDIYHSNIGRKTNDIMKTLAIAATIFAPLTFLTGVWGMNFKDMPGLNWRYGYPAALGFMLIIVFIMVMYFKKRKWI